MPAFVFTNARVEIGTTDLSDHVRRVTVGLPIDLVDATHMGLGARSRVPGLEDGDVVVEFQQDFDASKVDATLYPIRKTQTAVKVRPTTAAISATNPEYTMNCLLDGYSPMDGAVGDLAVVTATFRNSDGVPPVRDITP